MMNTNSNAGQMYDDDDDENQTSGDKGEEDSNQKQLLSDQFHPVGADHLADQIDLDEDEMDQEA